MHLKIHSSRFHQLHQNPLKCLSLGEKTGNTTVFSKNATAVTFQHYRYNTLWLLSLIKSLHVSRNYSCQSENLNPPFLLNYVVCVCVFPIMESFKTNASAFIIRNLISVSLEISPGQKSSDGLVLQFRTWTNLPEWIQVVSGFGWIYAHSLVGMWFCWFEQWNISSWTEIEPISLESPTLFWRSA